MGLGPRNLPNIWQIRRPFWDNCYLVTMVTNFSGLTPSPLDTINHPFLTYPLSKVTLTPPPRMITGNGSEVTDPPQIYPSLETDLVIGSLHLIAGVLAVIGNGVVFFAYFKDASQRASACMFVEVLIFRDRFCFEIYINIMVRSRIFGELHVISARLNYGLVVLKLRSFDYYFIKC